MFYHTVFDPKALSLETAHPSMKLLDAANGCCAGVTYCPSDEFGTPASHEDQEGFFFVEGHGFGLIDGQEVPVGPNSVMILPAGVSHTFRRASDSVPLKFYWFHAAI